MPDLFKQFKLGKTPARNLVKFKLSSFVDFSKLPKPPKNFGHEDLIGRKDWGVLGNDVAGSCVWSGAAHETMMWNLECGKKTNFDDKSVLADYAKVTGYNPNDPNTDNGTDMKVAAAWRKNNGIRDADGIVHKIEAYLSINPGDIRQHYVAMYLFGVVGIGIEFPASAMDQFNKGKSWSVVKGSRVKGGHYIPLVAKRKSLQCVTWGQVQPMTAGFFNKYNDESVCYLSTAMMKEKKSPEGFDYDGLVAALAQLK